MRNELVPQAKVSTILNGIDMSAFAPAAERHDAPQAARGDLRRKYQLPENAFIIGSVGRLSWEKDYEMLVRAFARLKPDMPDAVLVLVGDGASRDAIAQEAARCGAGGEVRLAGVQRQVADWLRLMDVFCLSSVTEGTSISLLEACACGLPAVVTRVGGNPEIVHDGRTGLTVPARDEVQMADAILQLYHDPARRSRFGAAAREHVMRHYSLETMVAAYLDVYRNVLAHRPPFSR